MKTGTLEERTMTVGPSEAAKRLGVSPRTLASWRSSGRGPGFVRVGGRLVRYRLLDLSAYLDTQSGRAVGE